MTTLLVIVYEQAKLFAALLVVLYLSLAVYAWVRTRQGKTHAALIEHYGLVLAGAMHFVLLIATVFMAHPTGGVNANLGFAQALSLAACAGVVLFAIEQYWVNLYALRPLALVLPVAAVILAALVKPVPTWLTSATAVHVATAIIAHGVALLACGHALLLWLVSGLLKSPSQQGWMARFSALTQISPPLIQLERMLIRLATWVAGLLALTILLGARQGHFSWDHKTAFTVLSLLAWLTVRWGYERSAWRGGRLCLAVWGASGCLLLAYIGSRFVLQAVLHRI